MPPYPVLTQRATFTTTTVFITGPTGAPIAPSGTVKVPIGAIVGGLLGGIFLAFVFVGGWIWWGKAIERKAQKQQPRLRSALKRDPYREGKRTGTPSSASVHDSRKSLSRTHSMAMAAASQKSVTFAGEPTEETKPGVPSPAGSTRNSEDRGRPRLDRTSDDKVRTVDERTSDDRERGRAGSMTPPPPVRSKFRQPPPRTPSAERAYAPVRPSPLAKEAVSRSPTFGGTTSKSSTRGGMVSRPPTPGGTAQAPLSRSPTPASPVQAEFSPNTSTVVTPPPLARFLSTQDTNSSDTNSPHTPRSVQPPSVPHSREPPASTPIRVSDFPVSSPAVPPAAPPRPNPDPLPMSASTTLAPPSPFRQVSHVSTVSAPTVYSQNGTASDIEPTRMRRSAVGSSEAGVSVTATNIQKGPGKKERGGS